MPPTKTRWKDILPDDIVEALRRVVDLVEATYGLDDQGRRNDCPPDKSAADIVEMLMDAETLFVNALDQVDEFVDISSTGRA